MDYSTQNVTSQAVNLPIHFIIVRDENGESNWNDYIDNDQSLYSMVEHANNTYFSQNNMSFYVCKVSTIYSNEAYDITSFTTDLPLLRSLSFSEDAINVYCVNSITNFGGYALPPTNDINGNMILISSGFNNLHRTFSHELGHYFGLHHTNASGPFVVVNTPYEGPQQCYACDESELIPDNFDCDGNNNGIIQITYGDFICDTPADPGPQTCPNFNCDEDCPGINDIAGNEFAPNKDNLMAFYHCQPYQLTSGQYQRMSSFLFNHPDYEFLLGTADCIDKGKVNKVSFSFDDATPPIANREFDPLPNVDIDITEMPTTASYSEVTNNDGDYDIYHNDLYDGNDEDVKVEINEILGTAGDHLNGVTTFDIVKIRKHLLIIEELPKAEYWIAADVNYSGSITTLDLVKMRKMVLLIDDEFERGSWAFVPEYYLGQQFDFNIAYENNPFTAVWTDQYGNSRSYMSDNPNEPSYFNEFTINKLNVDILNEESWNWRAIKIGDVNGSSSTESPGEPVFLTIDKEIVGNQAKYNFKVEGFEDIIGYQMEIDFDKFSLSYFNSLERDLAGVVQDFFGTTDASEGIIRTLWYDDVAAESKTLMDGEEIFQLVFDGTGDFSSANVTLMAESIGGQRIKSPAALQLKNFAIGKNGEIRPIILKTNGEANNLLSFEVMPNPFKSELNVQLQIAQTDEVTIEIHNVLGQSIFESTMIVPKGNQQISLNQLTNFSNGIYWISVKSGNQTYSRKVVKSN